jgi:hypothetical protein
MQIEYCEFYCAFHKYIWYTNTNCGSSRYLHEREEEIENWHEHIKQLQEYT